MSYQMLNIYIYIVYIHILYTIYVLYTMQAYGKYFKFKVGPLTVTQKRFISLMQNL